MKQRLQQFLTAAGMALLEAADVVGMSRARDRRLARELGISLDVPTEKSHDVTETERQAIQMERQLAGSEAMWLRPNGPRDQLCVEFNLTHAQVAGVLSSQTKRSNGSPPAEDAPAEPPAADGDGEDDEARAEAEFQAQLAAVTHDPETWPQIAVHPESKHPDEPFPPKGCKEYDTDEIDLAIVLAVLRHGGQDAYDKQRILIATKRRLTKQQVAELKARITREGLLAQAA